MTDNDVVGTDAPNGARLKCSGCGSEAIVTDGRGTALSCCGNPLDIIFAG